ncbi:MAG: NAD(P)-dependent oxidoreductase [Phycisphaerae bacterium]|nr:NAD(P)-dependent oxidoreductase [Phycisphaerae bacterium]
MKILVTGSSGFIGSHLTQALRQQGHEIVGLDIRDPLADFGINRFFKGDVRKKDSLMPATEGVDCVIHLAAVHFDYGHAPEEYWDTNENGMKGLVAAMTQAGIDKVIFFSTIAVYGDRYDESSEETKPNPTSPYGGSKLAAETILQAWAKENPAREVTVIRPCAVYGERNITNMNNLIRQIDSGFFVEIGSGNVVKATAYVGNLVDAALHCLSRLEPGVKIYNYTDKPDHTVRDIVAIIRDELGRKPRGLSFPLWLAILAATPFSLLAALTGKDFPVNIKRVKKITLPTLVNARTIREDGFVQKISTEQGLRRMVRHHLAKKGK